MVEAFQTSAISALNINGIASVEQRCFPAPWSFNACLAELSIPGGGGYAATCRDNATVVGYIFFRIIIDEMHILKIATIPPWRNRGIARSLLEKAIALARERWMKRICLEVRASNIPAIRLYTGYGFEKSGLRPGYYDNREDAILMTKNIMEGLPTWQRQ